MPFRKIDLMMETWVLLDIFESNLFTHMPSRYYQSTEDITAAVGATANCGGATTPNPWSGKMLLRLLNFHGAPGETPKKNHPAGYAAVPLVG